MSTTEPDPEHKYITSYCRGCELDVVPLFDYDHEEWYCPVCASSLPTNEVSFYEWMDFPTAFEFDGEMHSTR